MAMEIDLINNEDLFKAAEALLLHVDEDDGRCYHVANDDGISSLAEDDGTMTERLIGNDDRRSLFLVVVSSVGTKIQNHETKDATDVVYNDDEYNDDKFKMTCGSILTLKQVLVVPVYKYDEQYEECTCVLYILSGEKIAMIKK
ncbi:hypothetical protein Tco_0724377 [Tanacetum coccineum]